MKQILFILFMTLAALSLRADPPAPTQAPVTTGSSNAAHLALSGSGGKLLLSGSVTAADVGLGHVQDNVLGLPTTANFGNGAFHFNASGQFVSLVDPTNLVTTDGTNVAPVAAQSGTAAYAATSGTANSVPASAFYNLNLSTLPTSDPGGGQPWSNGGVIQVGP
jgi:hypothetical protein